MTTERDFAEALAKIAQGRTDCGRPLAAEDSRQLARRTLLAHGLDWKARCVSKCRDCGKKGEPSEMEHDEHGFAVHPKCLALRS